ncbi:CCA tRNA nucleotidyltransferase [Paenibacillus sp.]|uniref:CCA tRNA nucleotidyltransferase n=1 Tax=Paenibacillus sp. TaxID=58172 RepID=UPI002D2CBA3C|nr:CCA tRNA nucleotidyltransferase [Paenibacillus sp.]HZG85275.1 CCA tRNA nucleotidyltransferase [Paenibacillus sp.]
MTDSIRFEGGMGEGGMEIVRRLAEAGHAAYFVGGCVRDALLGRAVKDIDIATSAKPEAVLELFPNAIPTGLKHGTVTIPLRDWQYEVTTFRAESEYSDGRRPDEVVFIDDVEGDLERRDFTVNAMAVGADGRLVDPFGGRRDLAAKMLRAVGDPAERFGEDALRMLRFVRFAAEYGFAPDERTWAEAKAGAPGLAAIAMERVFGELSRMIAGADPYRALRLLAESELLRWTKERLRLPRELGLAAGVSDDPLPRLARVPDELARWALWFDRMGLGPEEADRACKALRTSGAFADAIRRTLGLHAHLRGAPEAAARRSWITGALRYGEETSRRWLALAAAAAETEPYGWAARYVDSGPLWLAEMSARTLKELAISGADVLAAAEGRKAGPWLQALLQRLLEHTALGELPNEREALLAQARVWLAESDGRKRDGI